MIRCSSATSGQNHPRRTQMRHWLRSKTGEVDYGHLSSQEDHSTLKSRFRRRSAAPRTGNIREPWLIDQSCATPRSGAAKFKLSHARDEPYANPTAMLRLALYRIRSAGRLFR
jgi:hypothetical protein